MTAGNKFAFQTEQIAVTTPPTSPKVGAEQNGVDGKR